MEKTSSSKPRLREFFAAGLTALACLSLLLMGSHGGLSQAHAQAADPSPPSEAVKLVFIHHSCGDNWLDTGNGNLSDQLGANNYYVSDTYYGWGPDSIGDNTDIGHWWTWFRGPSSSTYTQAVYDTTNQHASYTRPMADPGGENEIIMFKSCYPNSNLKGNADDPPTTDPNPLRGQSCGSAYHTVANAKGIYNDILEYFATRQDKLFVVITAPPVQSGTWADNARAFNTWLVEDWLDGYPHDNVAVFDLYNVLTSNGGSWNVNDFDWETGNHHRYRNSDIEYITDQGVNVAAYPNGGSDNHPSAAGNQKATGEFVPLLNIFYHRWKSSQSTTTYYVRPDGGSLDQCTGLVDAPYHGSGTGQPCAWDHPFRALPPDGSPHIAGGDTLVIGAGSYMMGYGAPGADNCESDYPWDCFMPPIPSGSDLAHPTRILGAGWDSGCSDPPELWGTERADMILNLADASNVEVGCLEITDHSGCVEFHSGGLACKRNTYPFGPWADTGLYAEDSANVHLRDLNIHGLASAGVRAGRLTDWAVEDVRIAGNGWVGWEGDIDGNDSNSGTLLFRRWTVEWNGCGETYPGEEPTGCWAQTAGGYGDGVGTGATGGHWIIEDSAFLHNTSDGLDLLYVREEGSLIEIRRTIAEGNAGNQIKTSGPTTVENSIIVGNCGFFDGQPFTFNVDNCRALGTALPLFLKPGNQATMINNTLTSEGDCLLTAECDGICDGSELVLVRNNIFQGHPDFLQPFENTCLTWTGGFPHDPFDMDYSVINDVKNNPCPGAHDICGVSPGLVNPAVDDFDAYLLSDSPAIDAGTTEGAPAVDFDGYPRDALPDIGAYEWHSGEVTPTPTATSTSTPTPTPTATSTPTSSDCPSYPPDFTLITDTEVYPMPDLAEPAPRQWFTDPTFDTCLVRVTDRANDLSPGDDSTGLVNEYARVQSFNADGSRLLAHGTEGTWYLYDAQMLLPLGELPLGVEPRWDADDPDVLYYSDETRLMSYNVQTTAQAEVRDFADDFPGQTLAAVWTRYEGSPSRDRRYWGLMAEDEDWIPIAFLVYDRHTDQVTIRDMRGVPGVEEDVDHVTMSPLGTYFLASFDHYCPPGELGDEAHPCGLMVYDRDLTNGRSLLRIIGHYDPALDTQGREVIIYQDIDTDHISMLDLATGAVTPLWEIDFSHTAIGLHFSGLAFDQPGWAVVSTHDDDAAIHTWMDDQVFLVELKPGGRVVRLAHTHSVVDESQPVECYYWAEPHASANPDLTRVLFTTNWGRFDTGEVEMFMIALPPDWSAGIPCDTVTGDLDCDCDVDIADIMLVASRWHTAEGDPDYVAAYDLDDDGDIDIVDIMLVAVHWGESC